MFNTKLIFPEQRASPLIATIAVVLIYLAIYWKDLASTWGVSSSMAATILAAGLFFGFGAWFMRQSWRARVPEFFMFAFVAAWILALVGQGRFNLSSYYIAIPCAFVLIHTNPRLFIKLLIINFVLTIFIQVTEYFSGEYFFVYHAEDGTALNESLFGGLLDVFRAKGLFQGPLSAVAFALWMAFFFRGNLLVALMLFFCAFFASGRLGLLTASLLIFVRILRGVKRRVALLRLMPVMLSLVMAAAILLIYSEENRLVFIFSALDLENDQNVSRIEFWQLSLMHYFSYSPEEMLVGNYGFILQKEGGTENDFLRILLDCGLVGFLIYVGAIILLFRAALRRQNREDMLITILIIVLMNIFPFIQSLSSTVLFWLYFFANVSQGALQNRGVFLEKLPNPMGSKQLA